MKQMTRIYSFFCVIRQIRVIRFKKRKKLCVLRVLCGGDSELVKFSTNSQFFLGLLTGSDSKIVVVKDNKAK
jgi:hypothetical protein